MANSKTTTNVCFSRAKECHNCQRKHRDLVMKEDDEAVFKRCTGCRLLSYCDQDCQKEHWRKVHRLHCKYLSGKESINASGHRKEECELCQAEQKTKKRFLCDLNHPMTECHLDLLMKRLPFLLARNFGYHDASTVCNCIGKDDPFSPSPVQMPFRVGEISNMYLGSGVEESLANICKLLYALIGKSKKTIPKVIMSKLLDANRLFNKFRSLLWATYLVFGNGEMAECLSARDFHAWGYQDVSEFKELLSSDFVHKVWGQAIRHQIESLFRMTEMRILAEVDRSCLNEAEYPHLVKFHDAKCLAKPLQVGTAWPTLVNGQLARVVPEGGKCFNCDRDLSGKVARYVCDGEQFSLIGLEPFVFPSVKDNFSCNNYACITKTMDNYSRRPTWCRWGEMEQAEYKDFSRYAKFCDQCLKASLNSHRCYACLSAQYCSEECRLKDLDWHKTVCEDWAKDKKRKMPDGKRQKTALRKLAKSFEIVKV